MKVYITKYALTSGIELVEADNTHTSSMVSYGRHGFAHGEGKEWHRTWEPALDRAIEMRNNKIASLRKSITKMERLTFAKPEST